MVLKFINEVVNMTKISKYITLQAYEIPGKTHSGIGNELWTIHNYDI